MAPWPPLSGTPHSGRDLVVALSPFEEPDERIVVAAERAGALGLLDLGRDAGAAREALARLGRSRHGVRVPVGCPLTPAELPEGTDTVLLADPRAYGVDPQVYGADPQVYGAGPDAARGPDGADAGPDGAVPAPGRAVPGHDWAGGGRRRVWAEITTPEEAVAACAAGVTALVARGHESGGRVGELTTCVLLSRVLADPSVTVPVLAAGGIGPHTAAAAVAGGAAGVLLDSQLALTTEGTARLPRAVADAIRAMDGSETTLVAGHRVLTRPDLAAPAAAMTTAGDDAGSTGARTGPATRIATLLGARDLQTQLLPVGQDGAFAARLAARHRTTGGVVQAVRTALAEHLAAAARTRPLAPRPGARHLPVAQGPMTRVSDVPAFAAAVAAEGGLPFLALAVMDGEQVRRLLAETAGRLGERPWGVGLLGFAPPELRREQLAAVAEFVPEYALIAGGRPAQAAPLEAAGTRTYLHVPAPGLLERYLAEGARRFVFEGQECGGHIGPRASFPLWEEQVERLAAHARTHGGTAGDLDLLFAGGIHDARTAAMAAAAAAPLAGLGARIGVLMGTAYLFTQEAVSTGAVLPGFQDTALACDRTVLLRTAPGHATRCAETAYTEEFTAVERRLAAQDTDPRTRWEELERRNLGRLRLASKGLRHTDGGPPAPVGEREQRREGLYMLGQAATARDATTTVAALHTAVTEGATAQLTARAEQFGAPGGQQDGHRGGKAEPLDIAIVGMACCYPGAADTARFWSNIVSGVDSVTEVPAERWDTGTYHDPDPARAGERTPSRWGGFLPAVPFDALAHGIPPASLAAIEPVQLLALEAAAKALADAGYAERDFDRARTSVVFGAEAGTELAGAYGLRALHPAYLGDLPPALDAELPRLTEDSFPGVLANVIAGRIAGRLDLGGANCTVDAACASSLAALDLACRQLRDHDSDMALCGGADVHNGINDYLMFASVRALSPTGRCRPFDAAADGIALGEGVGALVLKRLADAERDGDRIYAVVKAVGTSSDGRSLGLTAPRPEGQRRALERAYRRAGISPAQVGLLEAHGTGTVVGDTAELGVLTDVFEAAGATPGSCTLGSVKSQIGHTKCAAGLAGLIKAARAVHAGVRPPTLHLTRPAADPGPFRFDTGSARPWPVPVARRFAGVSAFGFGGTNYHAVLAGYDGAPEPDHALTHWPAELFCFRGTDRPAAVRAMERLAARLADNDAAGRPWPLRDLAAETAAAQGPVQICLVADDLDDLAVKLAAARRFDAVEGVYPRRRDTDPGLVSFLFPGQGSQRPGMMGELFLAFPALRGLLEDADPKWAAAMFPPTAFTAERRAAQQAALTDTRVAQPALGLASAAAHRLLTTLGVRPDCAAGHSYGELTALWAAGAYDTATLLRLSACRGEAILGAAGNDPGAMAAVVAAPERVRELIHAAGVVVANHNAPEQSVISGPTDAVESAVAALCAAGLDARRLPVACAFHSPQLAAARDTFAAELSAVQVAVPAFPVWSGATARPYDREASAVRATLADQVAAPVRFVEQIEDMYAAGVRTFVEAGPGRVLTGLVGRILDGRPHTAVALDVPGEPGLARLPHVLARLAAAGVPIAPEALFHGRTETLPAVAPRRPGWLVDGHLVRTADGDCLPGGLRPARRVETGWGTREGAASGGTMASGGSTVSGGSTASVGSTASGSTTAFGSTTASGDGARQGAVLEYLRASRELIAAQRDVVLRYLGAEGESGETEEATERAAASFAAPVRTGTGDAASPVAGADAALGAADDAAGQAPGTAARRLSPPELLDAVREIIHTRTGYPHDMLDAGLDLEADLSVDSIKRVEIIGALADRIGLPQNADGAMESAVEQLSRVKTISGIVDWIAAAHHEDVPETATSPEPAATLAGAGPAVALAGVGSAPAAAPPEPADSLSGPSRSSRSSRSFRLSESTPPAPTHPSTLPKPPAGAAAEAVAASAPVPQRPTRYLVQVAPLGPPASRPAAEVVAGSDFTVVEDGQGVALALTALLESHGARVRTVPAERLAEATADGVGGLVDLSALRAGRGAVLPGQYAGLRTALTGGARWLLLATAAGGTFGQDDAEDAPDPLPGAGLRGFARTAALEYPGVLIRAVDIDPKDRPERIAAHLLAELCAPGEPVVVGRTNGTRTTLRTVPTPLPHDRPATGRPLLDAGSVVLLTGGARGITARTAQALARAHGCHLELLGRTPLDEIPEDPALTHAHDRIALRAALLAQGLRRPAQIEAAATRILARREITGTLAALEPHAASVRYHAADVTDAAAVRAVVDDIRDRHGRLDGVVHGAGTLEDKLLRDKDPASFDRVFAVKVDGARHLLEAAGDDTGFLVLFGSVAGVFGNRGQADYAAANDALDTLARAWSARTAGRVLAVDWGPWAADGGGMVTPELERAYARRGIPLLDPGAAADALLAELAHGTSPQVVLAAAGGEAAGDE
ncbi:MULTISPECIES: type I polyketide synthase [unclassified Streptomyces]|uniref:type I polyketide synthase n=1 Tax=unclassified Streptomyces TaxID=2593676 RepID=UPI00088B574B|nr:MULTISPECIES: type I polyketide synthase [unclassified Streptomyces]PBC86362.1 acyl transferase domain-containing protein [Streptomyces sp. 2321.6]SDQ87168.1 Acyl transferase domain-containing protein [Streptomyces sp. KS_16]SED96070.1 Acyl transferase domain-containing protein [Streptomyces sp. 2133.1]SNC73244.1 Acyl transferase domain-containing protein [Streptomyces sp. 2114.4]